MRAKWENYFMRLAIVVSSRSTCVKRQVGAVIVSPNRHILATGYNGSLPRQVHCTASGCLLQNGKCVRTMHAEANAVTQSAAEGVSIRGADIYITYAPCLVCFKLLIASGIRDIYYLESKIDPMIQEIYSGRKNLFKVTREQNAPIIPNESHIPPHEQFDHLWFIVYLFLLALTAIICLKI